MRVVDRSVLKLIRMWLETPVYDSGEEEAKESSGSARRRARRREERFLPLLANLYLHWFDKEFHRPGGPAHWAGARLVRYADDFVVLSGYPGKRLYGWIESKLEGWLKLEINRDKTRVIDLGEEKASLESLGYTFRWNRDRYGRNSRYLHVGPSNKALQRERDKLAAMTDSHQCHKRWWVSLASAKLDKPCTTCVDPHQTGGLYG
jgi:RNA-directed DNA polymerase